MPLMKPKNRQADNERPCVKDLSSEWGCERCDGPISSGLHRKGKNSEADALWASSLRLTTFVGVLKRGKHHQRRPNLSCGQSHIADDWCRSQHNERTLHIEMHAFKEFREHSLFPGTTLVQRGNGVSRPPNHPHHLCASQASPELLPNEPTWYAHQMERKSPQSARPHTPPDMTES
jgi:hypothetical protein